jgi:hypothetical protein
LGQTINLRRAWKQRRNGNRSTARAFRGFPDTEWLDIFSRIVDVGWIELEVYNIGYNVGGAELESIPKRYRVGMGPES